jgi:hypothetical protein
MPTPGNIDYVLNGIGFSDATVKHAMLTITDIDTLEDLFYAFEDKIDKLTAEITLLEDDNNFRRADTRRLIQLNEWFWENFDKDTFHWNNFTRSVFVNFKRQKASEGKQARIAATQSMPTFSTTGPTVLNFSADIMKQDTVRMMSRANPGSTVTLMPLKIWISPFATMVCKHVNEPTGIIKLYRHLVQLAKSAEIDLCPLSSFDSAHALWPKNRCAEIIFEINDLLVSSSSPKMAF